MLGIAKQGLKMISGQLGCLARSRIFFFSPHRKEGQESKGQVYVLDCSRSRSQDKNSSVFKDLGGVPRNP